MRKKIKELYEHSTLVAKIRYSYLCLLVPFVLFLIFCFYNLWNNNRRYEDMINSSVMASQFSLDFQKDFDYETYLLIVGNKTLEESSLHDMLVEADDIVAGLEELTESQENLKRLTSVKKYLNNLETYIGRIEDNIREGNRYEDNMEIWENDVQGLCSMIQDYITQYTYYEMINMEQLQKELKVQMADQMQSYLALLLVVLVVGMFLAVTITKSITEPLQQLQRTAEQLGRGNLNARARTGGLEEINVLARAFNQMSDRIRRLLDKTRQEQKNLRELELRLHQEQISPHFLYNTLDSIVWMAEGGNNRQVVEMTTDLSDFFRTVLSGGRDFITIEEEESHIRSYLKIQKIRYEDILDYSIEIEPSIRHRIVLKMLLQPLVENALYHGIKNKRGGGCIVLRGYEDRNGLVFEVEDDGIGMDEAELAAVRAKLTLEPEEELAPIGSGGFGLHNVAQRIQMYYGDQAEILVESEKNIGTCFKVYLGNQKKS